MASPTHRSDPQRKMERIPFSGYTVAVSGIVSARIGWGVMENIVKSSLETINMESVWTGLLPQFKSDVFQQNKRSLLLGIGRCSPPNDPIRAMRSQRPGVRALAPSISPFLRREWDNSASRRCRAGNGHVLPHVTQAAQAASNAMASAWGFWYPQVGGFKGEASIWVRFPFFWALFPPVCGFERGTQS